MTRDQPNIVFIFSDQQHWQAIGCCDPYFQTPNWDALAAKGVRFENVYCTTPLCSPSRSTLMTGKMPHESGVPDNGIPLKQPTIAAKLQKAGYQTAYFGKWHLGDQPIATGGWDEKHGVCNEYKKPNRPLSDAETRQCAVDYLSGVDTSSKPFALFVSFDEPHGIYAAEPDGAYPSDFMEIPDVQPDTVLPKSWHREDLETRAIITKDVKGDRRDYATQIEDKATALRYREIYRNRVAEFDRSLGSVLEVIEERGLMENSIIVVTADHGDLDTHHKLAFKRACPYEQIQRVPLCFYLPFAMKAASGIVDSDSLISLLDLYPTLLDFAGAADDEVKGLSMKPLLTGEAESFPREEAVILFPDPALRTIRKGQWKYTIFPGRTDFLFDLSNDPDELYNLAGGEKYSQVEDELHKRLEQYVKSGSDRQRPE